jgi:hypothetical protein
MRQLLGTGPEASDNKNRYCRSRRTISENLSVRLCWAWNLLMHCKLCMYGIGLEKQEKENVELLNNFQGYAEDN